MQILMVRSDARLEDLKTRANLIRVLKATNKKSGTRELTDKQIGAIASAIIAGKQTEFCGRLFEVIN